MKNKHREEESCGAAVVEPPSTPLPPPLLGKRAAASTAMPRRRATAAPRTAPPPRSPPPSPSPPPPSAAVVHEPASHSMLPSSSPPPPASSTPDAMHMFSMWSRTMQDSMAVIHKLTDHVIYQQQQLNSPLLVSTGGGGGGGASMHGDEGSSHGGAGHGHVFVSSHSATVAEPGSHVINNHHHHTTVNHHVTNNNTFNLTVYLNEHCKDAINMSEFLQRLNISVEDLQTIAQEGSINGYANFISNRLLALEERRRPIHCTDMHRHTMHIREDGVWTRDTAHNDQTRRMVSTVMDQACRNTPSLEQVRQHRPFVNFDELLVEILGGNNNLSEEDRQNRIIRQFSRRIAVNKERARREMAAAQRLENSSRSRGGGRHASTTAVHGARGYVREADA